jgi:hypothetical protein
VAQVWNTSNTYTVPAWKLPGKWSFERPRRKWQHTIKADFMEMSCTDDNFIKLYQSRGSGIRNVKQWALTTTFADIAICSTCNIAPRNFGTFSALAALKPKHVFL